MSLRESWGVGMIEQMTIVCYDYPDVKCSLTVSLLAIFPLFFFFFFKLMFFFKSVLKNDNKMLYFFHCYDSLEYFRFNLTDSLKHAYINCK